MKSVFRFVSVLTLAATLSACASSTKTQEAKAKTSSAPLKVIDVHTHNHFSNKPERTSGIPDTKEQYLKELKDANVVAAVVHTSARGETPDASLKQHGIIHCAGLDAKFDARKLEADLKAGTYNCIKVYLGYVHQWASDPNYRPAYALAAKYDVPVVFHTGDTYSSKGKLKYSDPLTIDEVAVDFPTTRFVIAHCGNPWIQTAAEVAYKNPNVYLECSALLIGNLDEIPEETLQKLMIQPIRYVFDYVEGPSKLMFGTDWPLVGIKQYLEAYKRAIPEEHWNAVFHDNAVKVFKLKPATSQGSAQ